MRSLPSARKTARYRPSECFQSVRFVLLVFCSRGREESPPPPYLLRIYPPEFYFSVHFLSLSRYTWLCPKKKNVHRPLRSPATISSCHWIWLFFSAVSLSLFLSVCLSQWQQQQQSPSSRETTRARLVLVFLKKEKTKRTASARRNAPYVIDFMIAVAPFAACGVLSHEMQKYVHKYTHIYRIYEHL